jgi:hypothetical protein
MVYGVENGHSDAECEAFPSSRNILRKVAEDKTVMTTENTRLHFGV